MMDFIVKAVISALVISGFIGLAAVIGLTIGALDKPAHAAVADPVECVVSLQVNPRETHEYRGKVK